MTTRSVTSTSAAIASRLRQTLSLGVVAIALLLGACNSASGPTDDTAATEEDSAFLRDHPW